MRTSRPKSQAVPSLGDLERAYIECDEKRRTAINGQMAAARMVVQYEKRLAALCTLGRLHHRLDLKQWLK